MWDAGRRRYARPHSARRAGAALLLLGVAACGGVTPGRLARDSAVCLHPAPLPSIGLPGVVPAASLPAVVPSVAVPPMPGLTNLADPCPSLTPPAASTPAALPRAATDLHGVWFVDADHGWIAGGDARGQALVVSTSDGGTHWTAQGVRGTRALNKVLFVDRSHGWASLLDAPGMVLTTDGGQTWTPVGAFTVGVVGDMTFPDALHGWIDEISGPILATSDGGRSWRHVGRPPIQPAGIFFTDADHGWVAGNRDFRAGPLGPPGAPTSPVYVTTDGGVTWQPQRLPPQVDVATGIRFSSPLEGWTVGQAAGAGVVLGTHDGGQHWVVEAAVPGAFVNGAMTFRGGRYAWAAFGTQVIGTTDGVHWAGHPITHNIVGRSRLSFGDPNHGWIAGSDGVGPGGGYLLYTSDGGKTWSDLPVPRG